MVFHLIAHRALSEEIRPFIRSIASFELIAVFSDLGIFSISESLSTLPSVTSRAKYNKFKIDIKIKQIIIAIYY
ncbi:hypothetical protein BpHYR1_032794 [Brachionus plicatilis]|uniref:Uncharacterized protein n=1 Tax=Brachionus plicatilis TaxID=10195 RepID=A0A3M7ST22_BRAPC|nr:hypothetical protein BpHYR1_032794 [Brachionus plicatilis]